MCETSPPADDYNRVSLKLDEGNSQDSNPDDEDDEDSSDEDDDDSTEYINASYLNVCPGSDVFNAFQSKNTFTFLVVTVNQRLIG